MSAGHYHVVDDGKITEFHIFDDSQKWSIILNPLQTIILLNFMKSKIFI